MNLDSVITKVDIFNHMCIVRPIGGSA